MSGASRLVGWLISTACFALSHLLAGVGRHVDALWQDGSRHESLAGRHDHGDSRPVTAESLSTAVALGQQHKSPAGGASTSSSSTTSAPAGGGEPVLAVSATSSGSTADSAGAAGAAASAAAAAPLHSELDSVTVQAEHPAAAEPDPDVGACVALSVAPEGHAAGSAVETTRVLPGLSPVISARSDIAIIVQSTSSVAAAAPGLASVSTDDSSTGTRSTSQSRPAHPNAGASSATQPSQPFSLLDLPDACLHQVLTKCTAATLDCEDSPAAAAAAAAAQQTVCSLAQANSRLRSAVGVIRNITVKLTREDQLDSLRWYLQANGQHVHSLYLATSDPIALRFYVRELPPLLHLTSLSLHAASIQLLPDSPKSQQQMGGVQQQQSYGGVLQAVAGSTALKQLSLSNCRLVEGSAGLQVALTLPALDSLSLHELANALPSHPLAAYGDLRGAVGIAGEQLQQLQQLTCLSLSAYVLLSEQGADVLQYVAHLTSLLDLRLHFAYNGTFILEGQLAPLQHLTSLQLQGRPQFFNDDFDDKSGFQPGAFAGCSKLRRLKLVCLEPYNDDRRTSTDATAQFLSGLQALTKLTHLELHNVLEVEEQCAPAAAYAALTASSSLHHLVLKNVRAPPGFWGHLLPDGLQLPHMQVLDVAQLLDDTRPDELDDSDYYFEFTVYFLSTDTPRVVSCCPGLTQLLMTEINTAAQLSALRCLSGLQQLSVSCIDNAGLKLLASSCPPSLRRLCLSDSQGPDYNTSGLRALTTLKQLTTLELAQDEDEPVVTFTCKSPGQTPVFKQLKEYCRAQRAAQRATVTNSSPDAPPEAAAAVAQEQQDNGSVGPTPEQQQQ